MTRGEKADVSARLCLHVDFGVGRLSRETRHVHLGFIVRGRCVTYRAKEFLRYERLLSIVSSANVKRLVGRRLSRTTHHVGRDIVGAIVRNAERNNYIRVAMGS